MLVSKHSKRASREAASRGQGLGRWEREIAAGGGGQDRAKAKELLEGGGKGEGT